MFNNSHRIVFLMQFMKMTLNFQFSLTWKWPKMVGLKRLGGDVTFNFFQIFILKRIHFIEQNIEISEKFNDTKILAYL